MTALPLLVVEHQTTCPPAWLGSWLTEAGCTLDVRRPYVGDALPETLDGHSGMVVLGGSMDADADEAHPWLPRVRALIRLAAEEEVPVLGVCLGHQLAALALGGRVARNPRGQQIGVLDYGWTPEATADPLLAGLTGATSAVQWNNDIVVEEPPGTVVLARTPHGEVQAARFAPTVWGVQSHPEAGADVVRPWAESDRQHAAEQGVDVDEKVRDVAEAEESLRVAWRPLGLAFGELATRARAR